MEKVVILHQEAHRVDGKLPPRYFRHYYDVYKMYHSEVKEEALTDLKLLEEVKEFTMTFYYRAWSEFENVTPGKMKLLPNESTIQTLKKDYEAMKIMIYGDVPSFDAVMDTIKALENEINSKEIK